jgi:hypothetical protein
MTSPLRRFIIYLIGPESDQVVIPSNERATLIRESEFCMQTLTFFSVGDTIVIDEERAKMMRTVDPTRFTLGIAYGTKLQAVEVRGHGKQVVFEEVLET